MPNIEVIRSLPNAELTPHHERALAEYISRPFVIDANLAYITGVLSNIVDTDNIVFRPPENEIERLGGSEILIGPKNQFDLLLPTMMGLNEALVSAEEGGKFREWFVREFNRYTDLQDQGNDHLYGYLVYYPEYGDLVRYAPRDVNQLSLIASNAELLRDPNQQLSHDQVRQLFSQVRPAVAGASVGSVVAHNLIRVLRPEMLSIADRVNFKMTNGNRVGLTYRDIVASKMRQEQLMMAGVFTYYGQKNKAEVFAQQVHALDPYVTIYPFQDGVTEENVAAFVRGGTHIFEETDDFNAKLRIREECRRQGKPVIMVSDEGSWVQWDIRPYHLNQNLTLAVESTDENVYEMKQLAETAGRDGFLSFVDSIIGPYYRGSGEFAAILEGRLSRVVSSMPQLGSTASIAGGLATEICARMVLGYENIPERGIIDLLNYRIHTYGKMIGDLK